MLLVHLSRGKTNGNVRRVGGFCGGLSVSSFFVVFFGWLWEVNSLDGGTQVGNRKQCEEVIGQDAHKVDRGIGKSHTPQSEKLPGLNAVGQDQDEGGSWRGRGGGHSVV
ncbi:GQ67_04939T0 [Komagataella phaffii]|nr:GQ67_04939T0 [Komagataella phaffii]AOA70366.1 GQ68_04920T0 [Komagataella phaffii GS115]